MDLVLNNLQCLICHKTQPTNQPTNAKKSSLPNFLKSYLGGEQMDSCLSQAVQCKHPFPLFELLLPILFSSTIIFTNPSARAGYDTRSFF